MDLTEYVGQLPAVTIERLYEKPFTCLAVFRSLEEIEKQYVYRMLYCREGVPMEVVSSWLYMHSKNVHKRCLDTLDTLRIVQKKRNEQGDVSYWLQDSFKIHIQQALSGGVGRLFRRVEDDVRDAVPDMHVVNAYASEQWEKVLLSSIGSDAAILIPNPLGLPDCEPLDLMNILLTCGIVRRSNIGKTMEEMSITEFGFQFLLSDTYTQVWQVIKQYIMWVEEGKSRESFSSVVEFMLQLGFENECMETSEFSKEEMEICSHMAQLGLLYPFDYNGNMYLVPTKLAVMLSSGFSGGTQDEGFIIVETNFKVYAYTSSAVKQAILRLFIRCDLLLPNLFVGTITRESVMAALHSGVTADQIIGHLTQHAHKRVMSRVPVLPSVVADQIRLWQKEIKRIVEKPAVLYKNFETTELYKRVLVYAKSLDAVLVIDENKREFVALSVFHERIRDTIKSFKQHL